MAGGPVSEQRIIFGVVVEAITRYRRTLMMFLDGLEVTQKVVEGLDGT